MRNTLFVFLYALYFLIYNFITIVIKLINLYSNSNKTKSSFKNR